MAGFSAFQPAILCGDRGAPYNPMMPGGCGFTGSRSQHASIPREPSTRTQQPIVTGTAVLGLKYKGGVMIAADTLGLLYSN